MSEGFLGTMSPHLRPHPSTGDCINLSLCLEVYSDTEWSDTDHRPFIILAHQQIVYLIHEGIFNAVRYHD